MCCRKRKKSWSKAKVPASSASSKANLFSKKVILYIWCIWKDIIFYERLPKNPIIRRSVFTTKWIKGSNCLEANRIRQLKGIDLHLKRSRPYIHLSPWQKPLKLGPSWNILVHPPHFPNLAPSDCHLFRSVQNFLGDTKFIFPGRLEKLHRSVCLARTLELFSARD